MTSLCRSQSFSKRVVSRWTKLTVRPISAPLNAQNQNSSGLSEAETHPHTLTFIAPAYLFVKNL
jgi:hypothetical protein